MLIEIRASAPDAEAPAETGAGWVYATLGPAMTLFNVRSSSQAARNDQEVSLLKEVAEQRDFEFEAIPFTLDLEAPLSWHLSERDKGKIEEQLKEPANRDAFAAVERFLAASAPPA
ncbi:MAG TPA: hypothetical protein VHM02_15505 [Thermoanaerobaculia bacterium]|nr:hypothetical protein [Thermoanaerobaculia bacterium]